MTTKLRTCHQSDSVRFATRFFIPVLFAVILSSVSAQNAPAPATTPASPATPATAATTDNATTPEDAASASDLKSNVDEVSLDLIVHDKKHKLILDLKPEDIAITDNDVAVKLNRFHLVQGDDVRGHIITLLFDPFTGPNAKSAKLVADKILKVIPNKGYSFSVMDFRGRLRLIHGFTDDRKEVEDAVGIVTDSRAISMASSYTQSINIVKDSAADDARNKAAASEEKNLIAIARTGVDPSGRHVDPATRAKAQTLLNALQDTSSIAHEQHTRLNLAGLLALVKSQQRIGERKAIIYFTENQQMDSAAKEMLKTIAGAAAKASVSIYTVDLDALGNSTMYQAQNALLNGQQPFNPTPQEVLGSQGRATTIPMQQQSGTPLGVGAPINWGPAQDVAQITDFMRNGWEGNPFADTKSPLAGLAKDTGGAYIDTQNSLKKPLQEMVADLNTYYEASYVPPIKEYDGKFRTISVKPLRAGLNVQTKTGYFALAPGAEAGIRPFEASLLKTLTSPLLPTDVKFHAAVLRFGDLPDGNSNTVAVDVPLTEVDTKEDIHTNLYSAHVSIVAQIKDKSGAVIEHFGEDIVKRGALESLDRDRSATISLQRHFIAAPGNYTMEVAVLDQNSEKAGAQRVNFQIPDLAGTVALSDMVVVRKLDAVREEDEDDPLEPLRYEHDKIAANVTGVVPENAKGLSLFFFLHPDPAVKDPSTLEMEVIHNGKAGRRTPLHLHTDPARAAIPYLASFGSSALSPGEYEIKAYLTQGTKTTSQSVSFNVAGIAATPSGNASATAAADPALVMATETLAHAPGQLDITAATASAPALPAEESRLLIEDARQRALKYNDSLPNFMCIEVTNRSIDANGTGNWKLRDTIVEMLRYREKTENRVMLEVNGKTSSTDREAMKGALSAGEFGGVLKAIFRPESKANFEWKETDALNGGAVQVFNYKVLRANSMFSVTGSNDKELIVGFHGQVYIDTATRGVRRITLSADDLPRDFPTHATTIGVDYDYVAINAHDYLVPVSAELRLQQGRREAVLNTIEFRDYKRYGSNMKILTGYTPVSN